MRTALSSDRRSDVRLVRHATQALYSGQLPADLVVALLHGPASLRDVAVRKSVANLDSRPGTALVTEDGIRIEELIIEPKAGEFLGTGWHRHRVRLDEHGLDDALGIAPNEIRSE